MKYVVEGTEVVRDVVDAVDADMAKSIFRSKYPSCINISSVVALEEFNK